MTARRTDWSWRIVDAAGETVAHDVPHAASRFDAESWLGERWRCLAHRGATHAVLLADGRPTGPVVELRGFDG